MNSTASAARMMPSMRALTARPVTPRALEIRSAIRKLAYVSARNSALSRMAFATTSRVAREDVR